MSFKLKSVFAGNNAKQTDMDKVDTPDVAAEIIDKKAQLFDKDLRDIAGAIYKSLQTEGCESKQIISVSSELLNLVTRELEAKK